jgi:transposase
MVLTDERWAALAPLLEACRPRGKTPPRDLRRTIGAIVWRHANGATWRAIPAELGPWWRAAQLFIRWAELGAWRRLLEAAQARGVELGMAFLDGTSIRAHPKAAGAPKKGEPAPSATGGRRWGGRAGVSAPRRASSRTGGAARSPSR